MDLAEHIVDMLVEDSGMLAPGAPEMPAQCGWCRKFYRKVNGQAEFYTPEPPPDPKTVTHGICPGCRANMQKDIERLNPKPAPAVNDLVRT